VNRYRFIEAGKAGRRNVSRACVLLKDEWVVSVVIP
jgi:hypothetical protein